MEDNFIMMNQDERKPTKTDEKAKAQTRASSLSDNPVWEGAKFGNSLYELTVEKALEEMSDKRMPVVSSLLKGPGLVMGFAGHCREAQASHDPHPLTTAGVKTAADQVIGRFVPPSAQIAVDAAGIAGKFVQQRSAPKLERRTQELSVLGKRLPIPSLDDDPRYDVVEASGVAGALQLPQKAEEAVSGLLSQAALHLLNRGRELSASSSKKEPMRPTKRSRMEDRYPFFGARKQNEGKEKKEIVITEKHKNVGLRE